MQYILFRYLIALALEPTSRNNFVASYQQSLMFTISALEIQKDFHLYLNNLERITLFGLCSTKKPV
jgi:hypothetical protein